MNRTTDKILCADVTKLIAGDSWLEDGLCDPEAREAFSHLTTVMTNPTKTYFFKRANLNDGNLGVVARKWRSSANTDMPVSASRPLIWMDLEKAGWFAESFQGIAAEEAIRWVQFQSSSPKLMAVFWSDNKEKEELAPSYDALISAGANLTPLRSAFVKVAGDIRIPIVQESQRALANRGEALERHWTDAELAIAYLSWNYVKAFRYFESIKSAGTSTAYLVHFVRTHILDPHTGLRGPTVDTELDFLFPWGELLATPTLEPAEISER